MAQVKCSECNGTGYICPFCGSSNFRIYPTGLQICIDCDMNVLNPGGKDRRKKCPECNGTGYIGGTAPSSTTIMPPTCEGQWKPATQIAPPPKSDVNTAGMSAKEIYNLGVAAYNAKDFAKGAALYLKAAEMGNMHAQNSIAYRYEKGEGVPQDYAKAFYWYEKSAAQGFVQAMRSFGFCYSAGQGVKQDKTKALYWYTKAAENGNVLSMCNVGIFYRDGISVKQDFAKAEQWFNKAIAAGNESAKSELAKLKTKRGY